MKNTVVPTTKKLIGVLAIIGLMSVVLAKFFSDLAFAGDLPLQASLAGNAQFIGEYEVKTIVGNTKVDQQGNLCLQEAPVAPPSSDFRCGQRIWVYRSSEGKLVLINAVNGEEKFNDQTIPEPLLGGTIGKTEPITDPVSQPRIGMGGSHSKISMHGNSIQIREVQDADKTITLTPVAAPAQLTPATME